MRRARKLYCNNPVDQVSVQSLLSAELTSLSWSSLSSSSSSLLTLLCTVLFISVSPTRAQRRKVYPAHCQAPKTKHHPLVKTPFWSTNCSSDLSRWHLPEENLVDRNVAERAEQNTFHTLTTPYFKCQWAPKRRTVYHCSYQWQANQTFIIPSQFRQGNYLVGKRLWFGLKSLCYACHSRYGCICSYILYVASLTKWLTLDSHRTQTAVIWVKSRPCLTNRAPDLLLPTWALSLCTLHCLTRSDLTNSKGKHGSQ